MEKVQVKYDRIYEFLVEKLNEDLHRGRQPFKMTELLRNLADIYHLAKESESHRQRQLEKSIRHARGYGTD